MTHLFEALAVMTGVTPLLTGVAVTAQAIFIALWIWTARHAQALQRLPMSCELPGADANAWPRLSILIAALNEEHTIAPALAKLSALDYPDLEIIVVNDRSTDRTGAVIEAAAAHNPRIKPLHVQDLPPDWLGKVHALDTALAQASGDWVLCTDADVHFEASALKRAMSFVVAHRLDHLALFPDIASGGLWFDTTISQATWICLCLVNPAAIGTPGCRVPMGVGAFNLVRMQAMRQLEPFKTLRMEVLDDIGLAIVLARGGFRAALLASGSAVSLEYYASYRDMLHGLEKNAFAMAQYALGRALLSNGLVMMLPVAAFVLPLLLQPGATWVLVTALATYGACVAIQYRALARYMPELWRAAAFPVGVVLCAVAGLRSALLASRRGGITWRGTFYPLAALRRWQVTRLPLPPGDGPSAV